MISANHPDTDLDLVTARSSFIDRPQPYTAALFLVLYGVRVLVADGQVIEFQRHADGTRGRVRHGV